MIKKRIVAISGSTRHNSSNEAILRSIAALYADTVDFIFYTGLTELPHFNPDLDTKNVLPPVKEFRALIEKADGILICTPEYVFSLPGVLKNALEWTVSTTLFTDKPVAFIVASGVGEKTFESLSLILQTLGTKTGIEMKLLIQGSRNKVADGKIVDAVMLESIHKLMASLMESLPESKS